MPFHEHFPYHDSRDALSAPFPEFVFPDTVSPTTVEVVSFAVEMLRFVKKHAADPRQVDAQKGTATGVLGVYFREGDYYSDEDIDPQGTLTDPHDTFRYDSENDDFGTEEYFSGPGFDDGWDPVDEGQPAYDAQDQGDGKAEDGADDMGRLGAVVDISGARGNSTLSRRFLVELQLTEDQENALLSLYKTLGDEIRAARAIVNLQNFEWKTPKLIDYGISGQDNGNAFVRIDEGDPLDELDLQLTVDHAVVLGERAVLDAHPDELDELARSDPHPLDAPVSGLTLHALTQVLRGLNGT